MMTRNSIIIFLLLLSSFAQAQYQKMSRAEVTDSIKINGVWYKGIVKDSRIVGDSLITTIGNQRVATKVPKTNTDTIKRQIDSVNHRLDTLHVGPDTLNLKKKVDTTTTVNGKRLSANVTIMQTDVPLLTDSLGKKADTALVASKAGKDTTGAIRTDVESLKTTKAGKDTTGAIRNDVESLKASKASKDTTTALRTDLTTKVDKRNGYDLSSNDYSTADKTTVGLVPAKLDTVKQSRHSTYAGFRSMANPQTDVLYQTRAGNWYFVTDNTITDDSALALHNAGGTFLRQTDSVTLDMSWRSDGKPDGKAIADATMSAGSTTLTSATANFTSADIGKVIFVTNAKTGNICLPSTIVAVNSATSVTLANAANLSVTADSVVYGTDNTKAFEWLNRTARKYGTVTIVFKKGIYLTQYNNWMAGVKNAVVNGNGASMMCTLGAYNPSTFTGALQAFGMPTPFDNLDNNYGTTSVYGSSFGYLFHTTAANTDSIVLINPSDAANFSVGNWVLLGGFEGENNGGAPPLYKFHDWSKIISINSTTGGIRFDKPLLNTYDEQWADSTWAGGTAGHGAPRILNCNRSNFNIVENLAMNNLNFIPFPGWQNINAAANRNGRISFFGMLNGTFNNVSMQAAYVGCFRDMTWNNCKVANYYEPDKEGTNFTANGGTINGLSLGNLERMTFNNTTFTGQFGINAKFLKFDGCVFATYGLGGTAIVAGAGGNSRYEQTTLVNNQFVASDSSRPFMFSAGSARSLTVEAVPSSNTFTLSNSSWAASQGGRVVYPGVNGKTSSGKTVVVSRVYKYSDGNIGVQGVFSAPPVVGDIFSFNLGGNLVIQGKQAIVGKYAAGASLLYLQGGTTNIDRIDADSAYGGGGVAYMPFQSATDAQAIARSIPNAAATIKNVDTMLKAFVNIPQNFLAGNYNSTTSAIKSVTPRANNAVSGNGNFSVGRSATQLYSTVLPGGAAYNQTTTTTGAIKIVMPTAFIGVATRIAIQGTIIIGNSDSSIRFFIETGISTTGWSATATINIISSINRSLPFRFYNDASTGRYIYIGDLTTTWNGGYAISIDNYTVGAAFTPAQDSYVAGFGISTETAAFTGTLALNKTPGIIAPSASTLFNRANNTITAATNTDTLSTAFLKVTGGSYSAFQYATRDANGLVSWQTPPASGGALDATLPVSIGAAPSVSNSAGSAISSIAVSGHNASMTLTFTVPTGQTINGDVCTITYGNTWSAAPKASITPSFDASTFAAIGTQIGAGAETTTTFKVKAFNITAGTYTYTIKSMQ